MGIQVVTNENIGELIANGRVPDFKPPEAPKTDANPATSTNGGKEAAATGVDKSAEGASQGRGTDGKFTPAESKADATSAAPNDDDDAGDLPDRVRRQIGKKHRQMKEAEEFAVSEGRRALTAESRASALQAELDALKGKPTAKDSTSVALADDPEPKMEDFKTVGEYTRQLTKWEVRQAANAARAKGVEASEQAAAQAEARETANGFVERQTKFQESTPDYEAVLEDCELELHNAGMQYMVESDVGPQLAYWLALPENQHHINRLNKLSPRRMIAELGKLEDKLDASAQQPAAKDSGKTPAGNGAAASDNARQVSKAPAPIAPLVPDAAGNTPTHKDPQAMSFTELREYRKQEELKRGRRL
jgi:hypothetical protein